jgi:hypothetical protein
MKHLFGLASGRLLSGLLLLAVLALVYSCDNSDRLGLELTPDGERFDYHIDSSSVVIMSTLLQDSLTMERRNPVLIGSAIDDVFGMQKGSLATQLRLTSNNVEFGEGIQLDSVVLLLKYQGYYGDTTTLQNIKVFELSESLFFDSTYYSNLDLSGYYNDNQPIGQKEYSPTPSQDSLTIRLSDEFGLKILEADTSNLVDNVAFLEFLKGIYITTDEVSSNGAIAYFDIAGEKSRVTLYYSNNEDDSLSYEVLINDNCTWVNVYDHDYLNSEAGSFVNDSLYSHELVYLQAMSGLRASVQLQFGDSIMSAAELGIAINKAELIFPVAENYISGNREKPVSLAIFKALEDGTNEFIEDAFLGEAYYDGRYHSEKKAYVFNIARHVQNLLSPVADNRLENSGLFLVVNDARTTANGLVLKNGVDGSGAKLNITYTTIK